jgi:hypothetical protein
LFKEIVSSNSKDVPLKFKDYEVFDIQGHQTFEKDLNLFESLFSQHEKIQRESIKIDQIYKECHKEIVEKKRLEKMSEDSSREHSTDQKAPPSKRQSKSGDTPGSEPKKRSNVRTPLARSNGQKSRIRTKNGKVVDPKKKKPTKTEETHEPPKENVASFITSRSKKDPDSLNYNLRGEIKQNSKLEFDKKIYETNNPKRNKDRSTIEAPRTAEEYYLVIASYI